MNGIISISYKGDKSSMVEKFNSITEREGKTRSELILELIEEYVKNHAEGNPVYPLDKWQEEPDFQVLPTITTTDEKWNSYCKSLSKDEKAELINVLVKKLNLLKLANMEKKKSPIEVYLEKKAAGLINE